MGVDRTEISPALQAKLVYAGANLPSFEQARRMTAELLDIQTTTKQIERLTERAGQERCRERDAEVERYMSLPLVTRKDKPAGVTAPEVVAVSVDGGRIQILDRSTSEKAATDTAEEALEPDENHRGKHWFEDKVATCLVLESRESQDDPCPEVPKLFVDPSRMAKLTRELKTKKAARGEERGEAAAAGTVGEDSAKDAGKDTPKTAKVEWEAPEVKSKNLVVRFTNSVVVRSTLW